MGLSPRELLEYQNQRALIQSQNARRLWLARQNPDDLEGTHASAESSGSLHIASKNDFMTETLESTRWHVFHRIEGEEATYLLGPSWTTHKSGSIRLRGNLLVADEAEYLRQRPCLDFVICKYYDHASQLQAAQRAETENIALPPPIPVTETIQLLSEQMITAVEAFLNTQPSFRERFPQWISKEPIKSPFLFWYCYRSADCFDGLSEPHRKQLRLLTGWIDKNYNEFYTEAEGLFTSGFVSCQTMPLFFLPGEVVVSKLGTAIQGHIAEMPISEEDLTSRNVSKWCLRAWSYAFDGRFYRQSSNLYLDIDFSNHKNVNMTELAVVPLRFSSNEIRTKLIRRGKMAWECRHRAFFSLYGEGNDILKQGERYMIDFGTYEQQNSDSPKYKEVYRLSHARDRKELDESVMECDAAPQAPEILVFPRTLMGYSLQKNKWQNVELDMVQSMSWNRQAFDRLVIDEEKKELIRALVTDSIEPKESTDIIQGSGNRLTILLHGSPGTGKTHTAESVAEKVKKPLLHVKCCEIGYDPQEMQRYLEAIFYLGKLWRCVVLLDEADVFLEQRTLADPGRNVLVSVFLRALENYEGILIMTTNRVDAFDETFTSRIQLPIHYEPLSKSQRRRIWANFFNQLDLPERNDDEAQSTTKQNKRKFEGARGIDIDNLERHLAELAEEEMNGHQIRNAITMARQLARFKEERMSYKHLEHVIRISTRFNKHRGKARDDCASERMSWEDGRR
ncbi:putative 26S proteasome regulatory subunit MTBMA_c13930 [Colletotrichum spaethianum]|uniref:26S proteasome regulatory subunit MTBMA_c13930 n=1 Tax=Colletotrichum spaethianum TaxID=700344 RepID=A0AA37PCU5_9PEZI|nr:putative 26S proteasome regulatory subunit MTBMA_c13930 [Colletotrichum spaethianum]GKT49795.1 putative 26S proteasome regulatory subunit MTBMA_c13930 [Colletotrichum spaethianum]